MQKSVTRPSPTPRANDKEWEEWARQATDLLDGVSTRDVDLNTDGTSTFTELWTYAMPENTSWRVVANVVGKQQGGAGYGQFEWSARFRRDGGGATLGVVAAMFTSRSALAIDMGFSISGNDTVLKVKDDGSEMNWFGRVLVYEVQDDG